jgi:hypothetical protein
MHVFPAIRGFTESDGNSEGMSNNKRTCENMVFYNQTICMNNETTPSKEFFAEKKWFVEPVHGIYSKDQAAFGAWAIARYQNEWKVYYTTIKRFVDEDMLKPAEEEVNFKLAEDYLKGKLTDY